ncbi:DNA-binding protein [Streptomyces racemochromogenes]|uniref:DNA-binding protein n=1 Tax=Streptomyces racemochromogenes TaxID=67353 RepID=A0ABW7PKT1_9ACTN
MSTDTTRAQAGTDGGTDPAPGAAAAALLAAGAVLPADTTGAGPAAVPLTARTYRHPALGDGRVVVRLAAAELGAAEDLAAGFLGLVPDGEPAVVGLGRRQALGFPEWVLVHHPEDGHQALALVPELDRLARQAKTKPKAALDACTEICERLAASLPHFLPVFQEQAARVFLAVENTTYAAQLFGRARAAEARYGLAVDEDRLDAVFLEFALAGALPVKVLTGYAKDLAQRVPPAEAFTRFRRLCVRRTAGGLPPSAQATTELRRLARAAGLTGGVPEQEYLAELLPLPATLRAAAGWWKSHRAALIALARRVPSVRGTLLGMVPGGTGEAGELAAMWLEVLEESGATAGLADAGVPEEQRSPDGTAGWLERFHAARYAGWGNPPAAPALLALVERCADRIRAELALPGREQGLRIGLQDVNLLDLLLSLDLPVAGPAEDSKDVLGLEEWNRSPAPRDLRALCADARLRPAFFRTLNRFNSHMSGGRETVRRLAGTPGSSPLIAEWVREVAAESTASALPDLPEAIRRLTWLPSEALALAPKEVAEAAGADLDEVLARTLRGGLFEELEWPAWESAVRELTPGRGRGHLTVMDAWPYVIVANSTQVRVIGPDSTVLTHDLRAPSVNGRQLGFHYTDGDLLVFWASYNGPVEGYWLSAPDRVLTLDSSATYWSMRSGHVSLPLPGGGRTTGAGVLHRGDSLVPAERPVVSDGTSYWVWDGDRDTGGPGWTEYDPATGATGRRSAPRFLAEALEGHPGGATLPDNIGQNWLRPAPAVEGSVLGAPADGLLGWRAVRVPGGGWHGSDTAGGRVGVPEGGARPDAAVRLPGDERPRALTSDWRTLSLRDPEGAVTARTATQHHGAPHAAGAAELPPLAYWYCLRPRDPEGSAALRALDAPAAGALLKAAAAAERREELPALVREALPAIGSPVLVGGVVDVLRSALVQRKALARVAESLSGRPERPKPAVQRGPADQLLDAALHGLTGTPYHRSYGGEADASFALLRALGRAAADTAAEAVAGRVHVDVPKLAGSSSFPWAGLFLEAPAAVAYRAAVTGAAGTTDEQRTALCRMLAEVDALGLSSAEASAARWRRLTVRIDTAHLLGADGRERGRGSRHRAVLPLGGGALLALNEQTAEYPRGRQFDALLHDPAGVFAVPAPYTGAGEAVTVGDPERGAGWLAAFLEQAAERGPAPWFPSAAEEFGRLTGVSAAAAALVVAGLPYLETYERGFLPADARKLLGVKATEAAHARDDLRGLSPEVRRELVAALLPADPARLWTDGPDAAAAARVWNRRAGRRTPVPEWLLAEAGKEVRGAWPAHRALPALLDAAASPELSADTAWAVKGDRAEPVVPGGRPFDAGVLISAVGFAAWLAHRLPAGHPVRSCLPPVLTAIRQRLASPELLLSVGHYVDLAGFRKAAGTPTETAEGYERYGAVVLATQDGRPLPALRTALLDSTGSDPYLPLLRGTEQLPSATETALRLVHDPAFAALLADPGSPVAGEADGEGAWWPQDAGRSVPELVAEVSAAYELGADAAVLYLALLAMPDPTDRNTARWTGWKPARLKAARAELAATDLVVAGTRSRAGRSLFLPGPWAEPQAPALPVEQWKLPMYATAPGGRPVLGALVPAEPAAELYRRAWTRVREGDVPRFEELRVKRTTGRRR